MKLLDRCEKGLKKSIFSKRILIILTIIAVFMTACATVEDKAEITITPPSSPTISAAEINFESEVRLTAQGFDADEVNVKKGESLKIMIVDDDVNGHYLAINSERIAEKELKNGDKLDIPFDEEGSFEIVDETSGYSLTVNVE